ncbi:hypothetical protein AVEN_242916-1, partial [Araneus ventricosus]
ADNVRSLLSFPNRSIYLLMTMPTPFEKEMERLHTLLAEVETDEDSDFDNGHEKIFEDNLSDHENFSGHYPDGDSGN